MSDSLTRPQLRNVLNAIDGGATRGEIEVEVESRDFAPDDAIGSVGAAIDDGLLVEDDATGTFPTYTLADESEDRGEPEETADSPAEESGEADASCDEQGGEDDETAADEAVDALRDVLRFYNNRVDDTIDDHTEDGEHPDRPTTAREYFTEVRGWDDTTVDELLLGWAPADHSDQLVAYLHERGHDREAILATGAVGETDSGGFYTTFKGRYVLPYYNADGDPAYAIARVTGGDGGGGRDYGGHPADYKAGKYAKLRHTDERVPFDEPIYGLDTLEEGAHVVVAEGIADAITARELGYSVLSPVAKEFKEAHYEPLGDTLEEHHIGRMTIVADADGIRNGGAEQLEPDTIGDAVGGALSPVSAGLAGSLRTASKLGDRVDIDIRVAVPPAPADLENDLDEFVNGPWGGGLGAVLASAKPADAFDHLDDVVSDGPAAGYDGFDAEEYEPTATTAEETTDDIRDVYAALDRLDAQRVADRTIVSEWLEGRSKHRTFAPTWAPADYTGTANYVDDDKWVDTGGRGGYGGPAVMAAIDAGLVRDTECPRAVSGETWLKAVGHLRELGFSIPNLERTGEKETDPTAALPLAQLDALDSEEARRYASKRGVDWPDTSEARERLRSDIFQTMHHGDVRLHDAPTALGKSYTVATEPWRRRADTTGEQPVIHLSETREARDQAAAASEDAGVDYAKLLGRSEACPVAAGRHDPSDDGEEEPATVVTMDGIAASAWFEKMCEGRGLPFSVVHKHLEENNDQDVKLPCTHEGECESIAQWDGLPRGDEGEPAVDVIHATHGFAHVPSIRNSTNVIFDERPAFKTDLGHSRVRKAVAAFLQVSGAPVGTFEGLVSRAKNPDSTANEHAENAYVSDALEHEPDREWYMKADGAHTLAPALTRAIYYALRPDQNEGGAQDANGRYSATVPHQPPRLDKNAGVEDGWNRTWVSVVLDDENTIRSVRSSPDMSSARSVVALDAHPSVTLWQQNVHPDIRVESVLEPIERALWRRYERGLITVGVGEATRPLTSGEYFDEDGTRAFFEALHEQYGDRFRTAITAASVEHETRDLLDDVGVDDPDTMHYGEEKSRGDFGDEDIGALNGCIDPGDDYVLDLLAEAGLDATPETTINEDGIEHRAHGRGFEGPDAELAAELLASVREQHVAQGAGRYARNADDPNDSAIVFVRTDAAPTGFLDMTVPGVEWVATETQHRIVDALRERPSATTKELAEDVGASKEHVRNTLHRLRDRGIVSVREEAGDHGAHLYRAVSGLGGVDEVQLTPNNKTTNDRVLDPYTWSLAISPPEEAYGITPSASTRSTTCSNGSENVNRPGETTAEGDDPPS